MISTWSHTSGAYKAMLRDLAREGWTAVKQPPAPHGIVSTTMICPAKFLALNLQASADYATVGSSITTLHDGTGAPAFWRATADAPSPNLWRQAARAATRAAAGLDDAPNLYPGVVLQNLGWAHRQKYNDDQRVEHFYHAALNRALLYRHPVRDNHGAWTVVRSDVSIAIEVCFPEPRALPAFILALALLSTDGTLSTG